MEKRALLFILPFLCFASMASAAPITYDVTVDTSSISGTAGSLDFNFNPGPLVTQAASLQIPNFASNGALAGSPSLTGDVAGVLPATLTFDNGTGSTIISRVSRSARHCRFGSASLGPH